MPYIPPPVPQDTQRPTPFGNDFQNAMRMISERWRRYYPLISYEMISVAPTNRVDLDTVAGAAGATQFDPLWQESVAVGQGGLWQQPHLSAGTDASVDAADVFKPAANIHSQMRRDALKKELERWGFDRVRDLIAIIPCILLDAAGITAEPGDRITWDNDYYTVSQRTLDSFWKNTNVRIYAVLNCTSRRRGS